jgi:hypothetical protein
MNTRRTDRRRRVLRDETIANAGVNSLAVTPSTAESISAPKRRRYFASAKRRNQPRLTDLIPVRGLHLLLIAFSSAVVIGLMTWLDYSIRATGDLDTLAAFMFGSQASLAGWMQSTLMLLAATTCYLIYILRSHRCEDYRGTYRLWFALSACCLVASATSHIEILPAIAAAFELLKWNATIDPTMAIRVFAIGTVLLISIRTWFEIRNSRLATVTFYCAFSAYIGSIFVNNGAINSMVEPGLGANIAGALLLSAHFSWLLGLMLFARYVYLEAHGLLQTTAAVDRTKVKRAKRTKTRRAKAQTKTADTSEDSAKISADQEHLSNHSSDDSQPVQKPVLNTVEFETTRLPKKNPIPHSSGSVAESAELEQLNSKMASQTLSKSEKRRMRKLAKRDQRAA